MQQPWLRGVGVLSTSLRTTARQVKPGASFNGVVLLQTRNFKRCLGGIAVEGSARADPVASTSKLPDLTNTRLRSKETFTITESFPHTPPPTPSPHKVSVVLSALRDLRASGARNTTHVLNSLSNAPIPPPPPLPPPPLLSARGPNGHALSALLLHAVLLGLSALSLLRQQGKAAASSRESAENKLAQSQMEINLLLSCYSPSLDESGGEPWDRTKALGEVLKVLKKLEEKGTPIKTDRWTVLALLTLIEQSSSTSELALASPPPIFHPHSSPQITLSRPCPPSRESNLHAIPDLIPPPPLPPPPLSKFERARPLLGHWAWQAFAKQANTPNAKLPPETDSIICQSFLHLVLSSSPSYFMEDILHGLSTRTHLLHPLHFEPLITASIQHHYLPSLLSLVGPDSSLSSSQRISNSVFALSLLSSHPTLKYDLEWVKPVAEGLSAAVRQSVGSKKREWPIVGSPGGGNTSVLKKLGKRMRRLETMIQAERKWRRVVRANGRTKTSRVARAATKRVWFETGVPAEREEEAFGGKLEGRNEEVDVEAVKNGLKLLMDAFSLEESLHHIYADVAETIVRFNASSLSEDFIAKVLTSLVDTRQPRLALQLFDSIPRSHLTPALYHPLFSSSVLAISTALWYDMRHYTRFKPTLASYSARLSSFVKNGDLTSANCLWRDMLSRGVHPGRKEWNMRLWLIADKGGMYALNRCYNRMKKGDGVGVDEHSKAALIRGVQKRWMAGEKQVEHIVKLLPKLGEGGVVIKNLVLKSLTHWRVDLSEEKLVHLGRQVDERVGRRTVAAALRRRGSSLALRRRVMEGRWD